ncbi:MAG: hypothetical protein K6G81_02540 [Lachnospiraceae bacterium]|nr:hypothetical protein [Lachnospiraceae bacterium]
MARDQRRRNVVGIDGLEYREGRKIKSPNRGFFSHLTPEVIAAAILALIFLYLIINVMIYRSKKQVSIFEVQSQSIGYDKTFTGICIRSEELVRAAASGYINYYIANGGKASKNSIVYSVDSASTIYNTLGAQAGELKLSEDEIGRIKNVIYMRMKDYDGSNLSWIGSFENELNSAIYEIVNDNILDAALALRDGDSSGTNFIAYRTEVSGVVSYKADSFTGFSAEDIDADSFTGRDAGQRNLYSTGLIGAGDVVYRICTDDNWSVVVKVSEDFYVDNLEEREATVYLNGHSTPLTGTLRLYMQGSDYFAEVTFDKFMAGYIDDRYVDVRFGSVTDSGLKIPVSSICEKGYYLVPLSMFVDAEGYNGQVLKREIYNVDTGTTDYENIYPEKYFSDGYYAYIDMNDLNEGEYLCNTDTGERSKVGLVNYLEGVYNVNKGYYVFVRIEKIRSNSEYAIVKSNTPDGLRQYDHIALNSSDAVEQALIF